MRTSRMAITLSLAGATAAALAQPSMPTIDLEVTGHVLRPRKLEATEERLGQLRLPHGFSVSVFAEGLQKPRMLAVAEDGAVYVTRREPGDVWLLRDLDGDGQADEQRQLFEHKDLHGIALHGDAAFLASSTSILKAELDEDGGFARVRTLVDDLPAAGQHNNRTIAVGPDEKLYVSVGSTCNACAETTEESATLLQLDLHGKQRHIFAQGLRNTIGFGWNPRDGALWGMDHGIDWLGDDAQREELNRIEEGQQYGWPYVFEDGKANLSIEPPKAMTFEQWAERSKAPVLTYTAHSAPMQLAFYQGDQFPERYRDGAFLALHGSWNRRPPSGYEVVFIRFDGAGQPVAFEPFLSGFLTEEGDSSALFGRPCGVAVAHDGSLLVSDDANGMIYRVHYTGASE